MRESSLFEVFAVTIPHLVYMGTIDLPENGDRSIKRRLIDAEILPEGITYFCITDPNGGDYKTFFEKDEVCPAYILKRIRND